jgi:RNA-directed DNA polymerase
VSELHIFVGESFSEKPDFPGICRAQGQTNSSKNMTTT